MFQYLILKIAKIRLQLYDTNKNNYKQIFTVLTQFYQCLISNTDILTI